MTNPAQPAVLVHVASGIGNIVLATPLLAVLACDGFIVDLLIAADYGGVAELFEDWSAVRTIYDGRKGRPGLESYPVALAAIPPFYWRRFARQYERAKLAPYRPPDELFYQDEQAYYLEFARDLGCNVTSPPYYFLPPARQHRAAEPPTTVVLAPGSKPLEMAAKRWPFFAELAACFEDVSLVGTPDDLFQLDGAAYALSKPCAFADRPLVTQRNRRHVSRCQSSRLQRCWPGAYSRGARCADCAPFSPTPNTTLGRLPPNVTVLRAGLECEPCWFGARFGACHRRIDCLHDLSVERVARTVQNIIPTRPPVPSYG